MSAQFLLRLEPPVSSFTVEERGIAVWSFKDTCELVLDPLVADLDADVEAGALVGSDVVVDVLEVSS